MLQPLQPVFCTDHWSRFSKERQQLGCQSCLCVRSVWWKASLFKLFYTTNRCLILTLIDETCSHRKGSANLGKRSSPRRRRGAWVPQGSLFAVIILSKIPPQPSCKLVCSELAVQALPLQGKPLKSRTFGTQRPKSNSFEHVCVAFDQLRSDRTSHGQFWWQEIDAWWPLLDLRGLTASQLKSICRWKKEEEQLSKSFTV